MDPTRETLRLFASQGDKKNVFVEISKLTSFELKKEPVEVLRRAHAQGYATGIKGCGIVLTRKRTVSDIEVRGD